MSRKPRKGKPQRGHYRLRLFLAGHGPNSTHALANLRRLCAEHLNGCHTIETVDVTKNFDAAVKNNILVTPALILVTPLPSVTILGSLSNSENVLAALRLRGRQTQGDSPEALPRTAARRGS